MNKKLLLLIALFSCNNSIVGMSLNLHKFSLPHPLGQITRWAFNHPVITGAAATATLLASIYLGYKWNIKKPTASWLAKEKWPLRESLMNQTSLSNPQLDSYDNLDPALFDDYWQEEPKQYYYEKQPDLVLKRGIPHAIEQQESEQTFLRSTSDMNEKNDFSPKLLAGQSHDDLTQLDNQYEKKSEDHEKGKVSQNVICDKIESAQQESTVAREWKAMTAIDDTTSFESAGSNRYGHAINYLDQLPPHLKIELSKYHDIENFHAWNQKCKMVVQENLSKNLEIVAFCRGRYPEASLASAITAADLDKKIDEFKCAQQLFLRNKTHWVDPQIFRPTFFVQKLEIQPDDIVAFHGDIHGHISSLNAFLNFLASQGHMDENNPFKIKNPKLKIVMLGDYTDRGFHGIEVVYAIMQLKLLNPDQFFMVRGNHEDIGICSAYGFMQEMCSKFGQEEGKRLFEKVCSIYELLPVALYAKCKSNAILCCHGGLEIGFDKTQQLLAAPEKKCLISFNEIKRKTQTCQKRSFFQNYLSDIDQSLLCDMKVDRPLNRRYGSIGFMWSDFYFIRSNKEYEKVGFNNGRGFIFPEHFTQYYLSEIESNKFCKVRGIFRAHQHNNDTMPYILNETGISNPADKGVAKLWNDQQKDLPIGSLWDGIVCTFCVSPGEYYSKAFNYNFDTIGLLQVKEAFENWRLFVHQLEVELPQTT